MVGERLHDFNRFKRAYSINPEETVGSEDIIDHKNKMSEVSKKEQQSSETKSKNEDIEEVLKKED